jgi:hypothetical protein
VIVKVLANAGHRYVKKARAWHASLKKTLDRNPTIPVLTTNKYIPDLKLFIRVTASQNGQLDRILIWQADPIYILGLATQLSYTFEGKGWQVVCAYDLVSNTIYETEATRIIWGEANWGTGGNTNTYRQTRSYFAQGSDLWFKGNGYIIKNDAIYSSINEATYNAVTNHLPNPPPSGFTRGDIDYTGYILAEMTLDPPRAVLTIDFEYSGGSTHEPNVYGYRYYTHTDNIRDLRGVAAFGINVTHSESYNYSSYYDGLLMESWESQITFSGSYVQFFYTISDSMVLGVGNLSGNLDSYTQVVDNNVVEYTESNPHYPSLYLFDTLLSVDGIKSPFKTKIGYRGSNFFYEMDLIGVFGNYVFLAGHNKLPADPVQPDGSWIGILDIAEWVYADIWTGDPVTGTGEPVTWRDQHAKGSFWMPDEESMLSFYIFFTLWTFDTEYDSEPCTYLKFTRAEGSDIMDPLSWTLAEGPIFMPDPEFKGYTQTTNVFTPVSILKIPIPRYPPE